MNTNKQYLIILLCIAVLGLVMILIHALFPKSFEKVHTGYRSIVKNQAVYTWLALLAQLVGTAVMTGIAYALCVWLPVSSFSQVFFAVLAGVLGWSYLLFCTPGVKIPMYDYWFVTNQPLHARVVGKLLTINRRADSIQVTDDNVLRSFDSSSLREIGPGTHGILPWERTVRVISLKVKIVIGNGFGEGEKPLVVQTQNKIPLEFAWMTRLSAAQGHLVNLVQYTDESQIQEFGGVFRTFLIGWASKYTDTEIFEMMKTEERAKLQAEFNKLLGGKDVLDKFEKDRGMFSGDPQFNGIRYQAGYLEAQQALVKADMVSKARTKLLEGMSEAERKAMDPSMLMLLAVQMAGSLGNIEPFLIVGGGFGDSDPATILAAANEHRRNAKGQHGKNQPKK